jgi:hypothetical protein
MRLSCAFIAILTNRFGRDAIDRPAGIPGVLRTEHALRAVCRFPQRQRTGFGHRLGHGEKAARPSLRLL